MGRVHTKDGADVDDRYFKAGGRDTDKGPGLRWIAKKLTFQDLSAAATTGTADLFALPAHCMVHDALLYLDEDFAGGAVSAAVFSVGVTGTVEGYVLQTDVFTGATNAALLNPNMDTGATVVDETKGARGAFVYDGTSGDEHPKMGHYTAAARTVIGTLTTTTANTSVLTAGGVTVFLLVSNPLEAFVVG